MATTFQQSANKHGWNTANRLTFHCGDSKDKGDGNAFLFCIGVCVFGRSMQSGPCSGLCLFLRSFKACWRLLGTTGCRNLLRVGEADREWASI